MSVVINENMIIVIVLYALNNSPKMKTVTMIMQQPERTPNTKMNEPSKQNEYEMNMIKLVVQLNVI